MNQYQGLWSVWDEEAGSPRIVQRLGGHSGWSNLAEAEDAVSNMVQDDPEVPEIVAVVDIYNGKIIPIVGNRLQHDVHFPRREERVSYELHKTVVNKLLEDPEQVLNAIPDNVAKIHPNVSGGAHRLLDEWEELGKRQDIPGLINIMLGTDFHAIDMRQSGPFAGVLTQEERLEAIYRANPV